MCNTSEYEPMRLDYGDLTIWLMDFPSQKAEQLKSLFDHLSPVIPKWLTYLSVLNVTETAVNKDDYPILCQINMQPEYRQGTLNIYPRFWPESDKERCKIILHEIQHVYLSQLEGMVRDFIESAFPEPGPCKDFMNRQFPKAIEGTVEDLSEVMYKLIDKNGQTA